MSSLDPGGAERVVATLANHWARLGHSIALLTLDDGRRPPFYELDPAIRHLPLAVAGLSRGRLQSVTANVRRIRTLGRAIRASRPDAVLGFTDSTNVLTLCAAWPSSLPVVVSEHSDPERHPLPAAWRVLGRLTYGRAAAIVTPNAVTRDLLPRRLRARTRVIPNPIPRGAAPRSPSGGEAGLVISIGRFSAEKGHDLLLEAFARVAGRQPAWRLVIAGEGPERPALEALRDRLGLRERVELPGLVRDVGALLGRADLYVLASRREVFPMALCEAMASGVPPVAAEYRPGVREIVHDGIDGIVVPAGNVDALAEAMARLMCDDAERRRLGARAVDVLERYGVDRVLGLWEALLREVAPPTVAATPGSAARRDRTP